MMSGAALAILQKVSFKFKAQHTSLQKWEKKKLKEKDDQEQDNLNEKSGSFSSKNIRIKSQLLKNAYIWITALPKTKQDPVEIRIMADIIGKVRNETLALRSGNQKGKKYQSIWMSIINKINRFRNTFDVGIIGYYSHFGIGFEEIQKIKTLNCDSQPNDQTYSNMQELYSKIKIDLELDSLIFEETHDLSIQHNEKYLSIDYDKFDIEYYEVLLAPNGGYI